MFIYCDINLYDIYKVFLYCGSLSRIKGQMRPILSIGYFHLQFKYPSKVLILQAILSKHTIINSKPSTHCAEAAQG